MNPLTPKESAGIYGSMVVEIKDGKEVYNFCGLASHNCRECLQKNKGGGR